MLPGRRISVIDDTGTDDQIVDYLWQTATEHMGLSLGREASTPLVQITFRPRIDDLRLRRLLCGKAPPFPGVSTFQYAAGAGWRMASPAMRLAMLGACTDTIYVLIDGHPFPAPLR